MPFCRMLAQNLKGNASIFPKSDKDISSHNGRLNYKQDVITLPFRINLKVVTERALPMFRLAQVTVMAILKLAQEASLRHP